MRHCPIAFITLLCLIGCGASGSGRVKPATAGELDDAAPPSEPDRSGSEPKNESKKSPAKSETSGWSQVQPLESSTSGTSATKRKSQIVVTSDPAKHGDSLHFHFLVNSVPISGVFVAPGGQSTTFTIPIGTVHFTVDECSSEAQGFELLPDEQLPIACKMTKDGDCCEVAIPDDDRPAKK